VLKQKIFIDDRSHIVNTVCKKSSFCLERDGKKKLKEEEQQLLCIPIGNPLGGAHGKEKSKKSY
jgi:hypothetical protein